MIRLRVIGVEAPKIGDGLDRVKIGRLIQASQSGLGEVVNHPHPGSQYRVGLCQHYMPVVIMVIDDWLQAHVLDMLKVLEYMQVTGGLHPWDNMLKELMVHELHPGNCHRWRRVNPREVDSLPPRCPWQRR